MLPGPGKPHNKGLEATLTQVPRDAAEQWLAGTEANHLGFGIVHSSSMNLYEPTKKGNPWGKRERYAWVA